MENETFESILVIGESGIKDNDAGDEFNYDIL
jgi:hypothetical protein